MKNARIITIIAITLLLVMACGKQEKARPEPDRLGGWAHINQAVERGEGWRQIVTGSRFQFGEKTKREMNIPPEKLALIDEELPTYYDMQYGTYPSIDGSTVAIPMIAEFAWQHLGLADESVAQFAWVSTTHEAYVNLITKSYGWKNISSRKEVFCLDDKHPVDLLIATKPSDEELALAAEHGVTLVQKPVCYDAFVFITHKDNPVSNLTLDQVRKIYSGEITIWKEVGGKNTPIVAYQREPNSGSQTGMLDMVMQGTPMLPPETVEVVTGMGELIQAVAEYQNSGASIGYTYKFYIDRLYRSANIKVLSIDGVAPTDENVRSGAYPLSTSYYGVIRGGEEDGIGGKFLDWILSAEGQACVAQAGYIPITAVR
jgi:phosphate transport system substrate-binding protein